MEVEGREDYYQSSESENEEAVAIAKQTQAAQRLALGDYQADFDPIAVPSSSTVPPEASSSLEYELIEQLMESMEEREALDRLEAQGLLTKYGKGYIQAKSEALDLYMAQIVLRLGMQSAGKDLPCHPVAISIGKMNEFMQGFAKFDEKLNHQASIRLTKAVPKGHVSFQEALERSESDSDESSEAAKQVYPNIPRRSKHTGTPDIDRREDPASVRMANSTILKSKGLVRKRKRVERNPRVKNRLKFEKAMKKRRSTYGYKDKEFTAYYDGEKTGIRKDIVRSTKLT